MELRCVSQSEINVVHETINCYDLTEKEIKKVFDLVEQRAMNTSLPFKAYNAAHSAASKVITERK